MNRPGRIYLAAAAWETVERHADSDTQREVGGMLLGRRGVGPAGEFVEIESALPALAATSRAASLTFTHHTWAEVARQCDALGGDLTIVGWYHTHPGFGVFLSEHDLFIHRHFFAEPWQVALVVDPLGGTRGFFEWRDGAVSPAPWAVYAPREEAQALADLAERLRAGREVGVGVGKGVGDLGGRVPERFAAAVASRVDRLRSYVLLATIVGFLVLFINLTLVMSVTRLGREVEALRARVVRAGPLGRGRDLIAVGRYREALDELALARLVPADRAEADFHAHTAHDRLGEREAARGAIGRAAEADPGRYAPAFAGFIAEDLRRGAAWPAAVRGAAAEVRLDGLRRAADGTETAAAAAAQALADPDRAVVREAVRILLAAPAEAGQWALTDFALRVRREVAPGLHAAGNAAEAAQWLDVARAGFPDDLAVEDDFWYYRYKAGEADVAKVLEKARRFSRVADEVLAGDDRRARRRVVDAAAAKDGDWTRAILAKALADRDSSVRRAALAALEARGKAGDWPAVEDIGNALAGDPPPDFRREVVQALGRTKNEMAVAPLVAEIKSPTAEVKVRLAAVEALAELGEDFLRVPMLTAPDNAEVAKAIGDAHLVAKANTWYDRAYRAFAAGDFKGAQAALRPLGCVSGDRSVRWLRRQIERGLREAARQTAAGASQPASRLRTD